MIKGLKAAEQQVNSILVNTYWHIGYRIVKFEQKGHEKTEYGSELLKRLSKDLKQSYGNGFSRSNLQLIRQLYIKYPKYQKLGR